MPSCVIKSCRNHSGFVKKHQGITFHRFPSANDVWKNDWIQIIRECRSESDWNPSKSSVICSVHFEANDLYTTKNGLRRVITYAVPKKFLLAPPIIQDDVQGNISNDMHGGSSLIEAVASSSVKQTLEQSCFQGSTSLPEFPHDHRKVPVCLAYIHRGCNNSECKFRHPLDEAIGNEALPAMNVPPPPHKRPPLALGDDDSPPEPKIRRFNDEKNEESSTIETKPAGFDLEQPLSVLHTPRKRRLKESLHMRVEMQNQKRKIKTLNKRPPLPFVDDDSPPEPKIRRVNDEKIENSSVLELSSVSGQELISKQSLSLSTTLSSPQESPTIETKPAGFDLEQPLSVLYTPRKRRLKESLMRVRVVMQNQKKKIKTLNQKVQRLQDRNKSLKDILKTLKEENYIDIDLFNRLNENIVVANVFNNLNRKKLKKKIKYSPSIKKFCLTLNYYSPKAYDYVRQTFNTCLPHRKTLSKWYGHFKGEPGFTEESFQALKAKAQVSQHRPLCSLVFDEVAIRAQKIWDGKKYIGLEDMGSGVEEGAALASQALVFLLVGINHRFKLPLGYFLSNTLTGEQKSNLIKICLIKCFESDIDVISMTCDGHATNFNALELLGCNLKPNSLKTTFTHPSNNSEVACFLDPSHVIKLLRNQLESKREFVDKDENKIKWNVLEELSKLQEEEGLHLANKLTKKHVNFKNNIMKVKLATQVYSESVAIAIKMCREELKLPSFQDSEATENFIKKINNMFDIFNSREMTQFDFKKPLCPQNRDMIYNFLDDLKEYILNLRIKYVTKRKVKKEGRDIYVTTRYFKPVVDAKCKTGFLGTLINIESLKYMYEKHIEQEKRLIYLPTYKLSQDHLEMFFSCIRMQGGFNDNPNVRQFKGCYRKLLMHLELKCLTTGNCVPLEQIAVLNCSSAVQIINTTSPSYRHEEQDTCDSSLTFLKELTKEDFDLAKRLNIEELNNYRQLIIGYLAGSIAHYANKNVKCFKCIARLSTDDRHFFHKLINIKTRGGLHFPSKDMFDICCICEMVVRKLLKDNITIYNERQHRYMLTKILEKFISNDRVFLNLELEHTFAGTEHKISLIKYIADKYLNIRFHHISKLEGISRSCESKRQIYKNLTQHKGL